tara:strand:- start:390 stop:1025 length:636 start_codon:yes stop_codon:yes gene_type:complete
MSVNETSIIYDEKLFTFLDKIEKLFDTDHLGSTGYSERVYREIRGFISTNIYDLNHTKNPHCNNKDFFAIFIALISDYRNYNEWEELINACYKMEDVPDHEHEHVSNLTCCCGHNITNVYSIQNKSTSKKVIVGCDCVKKNMITNEDVQNQVKNIKKNKNKRRKKIKESKEKYNQCPQCKKYCIDNDKLNWKKCIRCYNGYLPRGKCYITV